MADRNSDELRGWGVRRRSTGTPMNETLSRQALRDRLDAVDEEQEARAWEREMRVPPEGKPRMRMSRWLRMCSREARYCPHKPACPR